jgi:hypothetical protein
MISNLTYACEVAKWSVSTAQYANRMSCSVIVRRCVQTERLHGGPTPGRPEEASGKRRTRKSRLVGAAWLDRLEEVRSRRAPSIWSSDHAGVADDHELGLSSLPDSPNRPRDTPPASASAAPSRTPYQRWLTGYGAARLDVCFLCRVRPAPSRPSDRRSDPTASVRRLSRNGNSALRSSTRPQCVRRRSLPARRSERAGAKAAAGQFDCTAIQWSQAPRKTTWLRHGERRDGEWARVRARKPRLTMTG